MDIETLNGSYGIEGKVQFLEGKGGLPVVELLNANGRTIVSLYGGHLLAYEPTGQDPVIWISEEAIYRIGKAIRGGIPVCWPWFGAHPEDPDGRPSHGFARLRLWEVRGTSSQDGLTSVRLGLSDSAATRALWPAAFDLELTVTLGPELKIELATRNAGDSEFRITEALHSYFRVSDCTKVAVEGLDGCVYLDQTDDWNQKIESGDVTVSGEVDRTYLNTTAECRLKDPGLDRTIRIAKNGSASTVIWNPWATKASKMQDFGDGEYSGMLCVETANAYGNTILVPAGEKHVMTAVIAVE